MTRNAAMIFGVLGMGLAFAAGAEDAATGPKLRLFLSEVQAGSMASEHYCALVFTDHHFHYEKASRSIGKDRERSVYEGELSQADWDSLDGILDNKDFSDLKVPQEAPPVVVEDAHTIAISVAREAQFQNMEFLNNKSRKPYDSQLKPLMKWWKSFRGTRMQKSSAQPDSRCSLDSTHGVFSN